MQPHVNKLQSSSYAENNNNNNSYRLKKGSSLDSINAVERELDEVLKDLEMNSSDLNLVSEQLNNNNSTNSTPQNIQLPITIHQSHLKNLTPTSSFINNNNNNKMPTNSEFLLTTTQQSQSNTNINNLENNNSRLNRDLSSSTDNKRRQNIISTYEICQDCYDTSGQHQSGDCQKLKYQKQQQQQTIKSSDFTPILSNLNENQILNHQTSTLNTTIPLKITLSSAYADNKSQAATNGKPPIAVRINKNNSILINNPNKTILHQPSTSTPRTCTLQKSVTIAEQSPSPKLNGLRSRSIPTTHYSSSDENSNSTGKEQKIEKLPPVPPSAWTNSRKKFQSPVFSTSGNATMNNNNNNNECKYNNGDCELSINEAFDSTNSKPLGNNRNYDNVINYSIGNMLDECEKIEIIVNKDHRYGDYGFSIADSLFGKGVFVNKVRNSNQYAYLQPYTQIFKVRKGLILLKFLIFSCAGLIFG